LVHPFQEVDHPCQEVGHPYLEVDHPFLVEELPFLVEVLPYQVLLVRVLAFVAVAFALEQTQALLGLVAYPTQVA